MNVKIANKREVILYDEICTADDNEGNEWPIENIMAILEIT